MKFTVIAGNWAARYMKPGSIEMNIPKQSTVAGALKQLPVPIDEIGVTALNGKAVKHEQALAEGDVLQIFPVIIGG